MAPKTIHDLQREGTALLCGLPQGALEAKVLLLKAIGLSETRLLASPERVVSLRREELFFRLVRERLAGRPLAYVTGRKEFWSMPFRVSASVLIPRPETEMLVERVLTLSSRGRELILDMGTGSGNIAVALARELPAANLCAADVSLRALRMARRNAVSQELDRIEFVRSNLFSAFRGSGRRFDFIVSNPPYIARGEWESLPAEVREHEPRRALLAGETGLEFIGRLIRGARRFLRPGGYLIFEMGETQHRPVLAMFGRGWMEVETGWDLAGKPRFITARTPG